MCFANLKRISNILKLLFTFFGRVLILVHRSVDWWIFTDSWISHEKKNMFSKVLSESPHTFPTCTRSRSSPTTTGHSTWIPLVPISTSLWATPLVARFRFRIRWTLTTSTPCTIACSTSNWASTPGTWVSKSLMRNLWLCIWGCITLEHVLNIFRPRMWLYMTLSYFVWFLFFSFWFNKYQQVPDLRHSNSFNWGPYPKFHTLLVVVKVEVVVEVVVVDLA